MDRHVSDTLRSQLQQTLGDGYTLERELGGGGMSRVFVARENALGREVVVKVLAPELSASVSAERFTREIATAARLQQANIVPVLAAGTSDGVPYYTMPFVTGESLRTQMTSGAPLSMHDRVAVLRDVARALAYAHTQGVIHRDIKPENILLSGGAAVVTDFGIAKAISAARTVDGPSLAASDGTLTQVGSSVGTPAYMAPEQAVGESIDARADLYAWGVVAYELLAGTHPFAGKSGASQLIAAHIAEVPQPLLMRAPTVPREVAALVMRCLAKDPNERPSGANALLEQLATASTSSAERPVPTANPRRRPALVAAAAVVVSIGVGTALWMTTRGGARGAADAGVAAAAGARAASDTAATSERSLVVLPFTSVGGDTANSYFAAGIADELTSALMQIPGLRLAGRASAARVKQQGGGATEIGRTLNVTSVLDGSVRRSGDRIRVLAELTSASDERVLWSQTYERALADVFAVQDEITREIVSALRVQLTAVSGTRGMSARGGTRNLEAYDLYLRALPLYKGRGGRGLLQAERYLVEAIKRDPDYARAHAMLASTLLAQPYFAPVRARDVAERARAAAMRAIALDDSLADGHQALAHSHAERNEWSAARREYERALALDPRLVEAHYRLGEMLYRMGLARESLGHFEAANRLDPLYSQNNSYRSLTLAMLGRIDEATAVAERALLLDPENINLNQWYAHVLEFAGRREETKAQARRLIAIRDVPLARIGSAAGLLGRAGARDEARALLRRVAASPVGTHERDVAILFSRLGLEDMEAAMTALETAARSDPHRVAAYGLVGFGYDPLRSDPRFATVLRALDLDVARLTLPDGGRSR
jgi:serine/threonine-protein kinase